MAQYKVYFLIASIILFQRNSLLGQGCSDAGFCTINSFKPKTNDTSLDKTNQIKVGAFYGNADNSIVVYGNYLEYNKQLNTKLGIDFKLTTLAQSGNNISVFGLSDAYINTNYKFNSKFVFTIGAKIPLSNSGGEHNALPLPMDYQSSLGTFDVILGIGYRIKKFQFVAALQQPLTQNQNQFLAENYPAISKLSTFPSTNKFQRSGDVLLRVSYPIFLNNKWTITPGILPIYHLKNDKYTNAMNIESEIVGSNGLTLNGNIYLDYKINKKSFLQLNTGMPFIVRDKRPDGLTRSLIANLEYRLKF